MVAAANCFYFFYQTLEFFKTRKWEIITVIFLFFLPLHKLGRSLVKHSRQSGVFVIFHQETFNLAGVKEI